MVVDDGSDDSTVVVAMVACGAATVMVDVSPLLRMVSTRPTVGAVEDADVAVLDDSDEEADVEETDVEASSTHNQQLTLVDAHVP